MEHDDIYGWIYKYDRKARVWRAFYSTDDTEVNQYHKAKLFSVMGKYEDKINGDSREWDFLPASIREPALTMEERTQFLFQVE